MIWTPYNWLNKFYNYYMVTIVSIVWGVALELKLVVETNLIRVSYHCISHSFHFKSHLKQLYLSNKTEHLSYKIGCGVYGCRSMKTLYKKSARDVDKQLQVAINIIYCYSIYNSHTNKKLKSKAVLSLKQYWIHCYVYMWILVTKYK